MHAIRLRQPWQQEWYSQTLPIARYRRSFNCPSGLTPEQSVWLVVRPLGAAVVIQSIGLNMQQLHPSVSADRALRARIQDLLQPFNRLEILCEIATGTGWPPEITELLEVSLEIGEPPVLDS